MWRLKKKRLRLNLTKVRKRVDLLEIESTLLGMLSMDKCLVSAEKTEYATDAIIVYYTTPDKKKLNEKHIMEVLEQILPTYMLPSRFVHQDEFPLTPNGKVDRLKIINQCKTEEESNNRIT